VLRARLSETVTDELTVVFGVVDLPAFWQLLGRAIARQIKAIIGYCFIGGIKVDFLVNLSYRAP
jgi:hypothetical protein